MSEGLPILGVFARPNHPVGYGSCQAYAAKDPSLVGPNHPASAEGYVVVIVRAESWDRLAEVTKRFRQSMMFPEASDVQQPAFDPWRRGDDWYAGPYELVWAAQVEHLSNESGIAAPGPGMFLGVRAEYGDNRAMAYLTAEEVLSEGRE